MAAGSSQQLFAQAGIVDERIADERDVAFACGTRRGEALGLGEEGECIIPGFGFQLDPRVLADEYLRQIPADSVKDEAGGGVVG